MTGRPGPPGRALRGELLKVRRSAVPATTLLVTLLIPLVGGLFMFIAGDPDRARSLGLLGQKAELAGVTADWAGLIGFVTQAVAAASLMVYSFVATWLFGREFVDGTARYLMALPIARDRIVAAKLVVLAGWSALLAVWVALVTVVVGAVMRLPGWDSAAVLAGLGRILVAGLLMIPAVLPVAYLASRTRGYLGALAIALLLLLVGQVAAILGWGAVVPWSIPALAAGVAPGQHAGAGSILICLLTGVAGAVATVRWWRSPDAGM